MKILLVEDSTRLQRSLSAGLIKFGYAVDQAFDGKEALAFVAINKYDVIILDLMLAEIDGLTVQKKIRNDGNDSHVLILSANDQAEDRVQGLDLGADDYLIKPFSLAELVSRLRALYRRRHGPKNPTIEIEGVKIDSVSRFVYYDGKEVALTPHEFVLLEYLVRRRGHVFSHEQLIEQIYDASSYVSKNAVEAHISTLRKRLHAANAPSLIKTRAALGTWLSSCYREHVLDKKKTHPYHTYWHDSGAVGDHGISLLPVSQGRAIHVRCRTAGQGACNDFAY